MKSWANKVGGILFIAAMLLPMHASAEEKKSFWAKLVPDNSSAFDFVDDGKAFFGQLLEDSKETGKALITTGKNAIDSTGETLKSLTKGD